MNTTDAKAFKRFCKWLGLIAFPGYQFEVVWDQRLYLRAFYYEADSLKPKSQPVVQKTRKWQLSVHMTKSEFVQTALKCVLTSYEHKVREHFRYKGRLVFGPHHNIDRLWKVSADNQVDRRP